MKVALLFFGQLRYANNPHTYESHKKFIIDRYDTDVFAHTWWSPNEQTYTTAGHIADQNPIVQANAADLFSCGYCLARSKIEPSKLFQEDADILLQKIKAKGDWPHLAQHKPNYWFLRDRACNNTISHSYSIEEVGKLLKSYMDDFGTQYDWIILSRPDICIWDYPDLNKLEHDCFFLSNHHPRFPDLQFIFSPKYMQFLNLYSHVTNISNQELHSLWEPNGEALKFSNYRTHFDERNLRRIPLLVRIVRGDNCRGPQW